MLSKNFLISSLLFLSVSCSNKIGKLSDIGAPEWVFAPYSISDKEEKETYFAGVGMACKTDTGIKVQILKAEVDARLNIAKQVGVDINSSVEDFVSENEKTGDEKLKYVKTFQSSTKEMIDALPVVDSIRTNIWQNPKDDCIFVRLIAPKEPIRKFVSEKMKISLDAIKDQKYKKDLESKVLSGIDQNSNQLIDIKKENPEIK